MRALVSLLLAALLLGVTGPARAVWVVDEHGACVERWATADLLRGPTAMLNGLLRPIRTTAGGAVYAWNQDAWWPWQIIGLGPGATLISGGAGLIEGVWWMGTGLVDTVTGGALHVSSEKAVDLAISPEVSTIIADAERPEPATDPCGRPTSHGAAEDTESSHVSRLAVEGPTLRLGVL